MRPREFYTALPGEVTVAQAQGVLAALLDVSIADAATSLDLKAQFSRLSLEGRRTTGPGRPPATGQC
jgi:hypothetical protein